MSSMPARAEDEVAKLKRSREQTSSPEHSDPKRSKTEEPDAAVPATADEPPANDISAAMASPIPERANALVSAGDEASDVTGVPIGNVAVDGTPVSLAPAPLAQLSSTEIIPPPMPEGPVSPPTEDTSVTVHVNNSQVLGEVANFTRRYLGSVVYAPNRALVRGHELDFNCVLQVRLSHSFLSEAEAVLADRKLWGTEVYSDDSDLIAALYHLGYLPRKRTSQVVDALEKPALRGNAEKEECQKKDGSLDSGAQKENARMAQDQPEKKPETQSEMQPETQTEAQVEDTETKPEGKSGNQAEGQAESQVEDQAEGQADIQGKAQAEAQTDNYSKEEIQPETESAVDKSETEPNPTDADSKPAENELKPVEDASELVEGEAKPVEADPKEAESKPEETAITPTAPEEPKETSEEVKTSATVKPTPKSLAALDKTTRKLMARRQKPARNGEPDLLVEILLLPGLRRYTGSKRNGLTSRSWLFGHDGISYMVLGEPKEMPSGWATSGKETLENRFLALQELRNWDPRNIVYT